MKIISLLKLKFFLFFLVLLSTFACKNIFTNDKNNTHYFEFASGKEEIDYTFIVKTSDPELIKKVATQLKRPFEERTLHINGNIEKGKRGYNFEWNWYFVPDEWDLVEISAEVCDGDPQMVEKNLDYWTSHLGYFCPWSSRVLREVHSP